MSKHDHIFHDRDDGLLHCKVCGGAEGSLPTRCPTYRMPAEVIDAVYANQLNFNDGPMSRGPVWWRYVVGELVPQPDKGPKRCTACDCTGDVHSIDGEWRGQCEFCMPNKELLDNIKYLLDRCPYTVRVREGGGPESLLDSLIATFMGMQHRLEGLEK